MNSILRFYFRRFKVIKRKSKKKIKKSSRENFLKHKNDTKILVLERLNFYNLHYKFSYNRITIKNVTSRWGSCSRKNNLNFNYRIAHLPKELSDYIVVHELCHLGQFNHSQKFWDLVEETIPNYLELRNKLKKIRVR